MRISDWSSDVCSSDLELLHLLDAAVFGRRAQETQLARTAVGAPEIRAVDNDPTAQPRRDQDVEKARQRLPEPELHLAHRGGGGVVLDEDGQVERDRTSTRLNSNH